MEPEKLQPLSNTRTFLESWDDPDHPGNASVGPLVVGSTGRINTTGQRDAPAFSFSRHNPLFSEAIELGIRPLVFALINRLDCVTFTSCDGHRNDCAELESLKTVGIFCRSVQERDELEVDLGRLIGVAHQQWDDDSYITLERQFISTEEGEKEYLELCFRGHEDNPAEYLSRSSTLSTRLVMALEDDHA